MGGPIKVLERINMDTYYIAKYYQEADAMKRKAYLDKAIEAGEEPEKNAIRREIWQVRYSRPLDGKKEDRADDFLGFWMTLEFHRDAEKRWFGKKSAVKSLKKSLRQVKFLEIKEKSPLHRELLYQECCHLVDLYIRLCEEDRSYNSFLCGLMTFKKEDAKNKLQKDIRQVGMELPKVLGMEKELDVLMEAAKTMYQIHYGEEV